MSVKKTQSSVFAVSKESAPLNPFQYAPTQCKEILSLQDAARYLGISTRNFRQKVTARIFPHFKVGRLYFVRKSELDKAISRLEVSAV